MDVDDAGNGVRFVVVGKTEVPYPTLESIAVTIPPEVEGVVKGAPTPPTSDARKQTSQFVSITSFTGSKVLTSDRLTTLFLSTGYRKNPQ